MLYLSRITDATVDAFATCGFNARMRKYASCGPRLIDDIAVGLVIMIELFPLVRLGGGLDI